MGKFILFLMLCLCPMLAKAQPGVFNMLIVDALDDPVGQFAHISMSPSGAIIESVVYFPHPQPAVVAAGMEHVAVRVRRNVLSIPGGDGLFYASVDCTGTTHASFRNLANFDIDLIGTTLLTVVDGPRVDQNGDLWLQGVDDTGQINAQSRFVGGLCMSFVSTIRTSTPFFFMDADDFLFPMKLVLEPVGQ